MRSWNIPESNFMKSQFSLAYLTVAGCSPPDMVEIAARTGYDYVGLRLIPMGIPGEQSFLPDDREMIEKTKAAIRETGVKVFDLELARILEDVEPRSYLPAMETAAELGAEHVISSAWTNAETEYSFIVERFAEICDLAATFDLKVSLEFPTFSSLKNLNEAAAVVLKADRPNGGILIDTLYFHYSRVRLEELEVLPSDLFSFIHICDTTDHIPETRDGMIHVARDERLYIGEGCIDFASIMEKLPPLVYSIELPNLTRVKEYGYEGHARRCIESAKQQLNHLGKVAWDVMAGSPSS